MLVGFRILDQLRFIVDIWIRYFETTNESFMVGFNIFDTINFGQIAPDRGGTSSSDHVGDAEGDQGYFGPGRRVLFGWRHCGAWVVGFLAANPGGCQPREEQRR